MPWTRRRVSDADLNRALDAVHRHAEFTSGPTTQEGIRRELDRIVTRAEELERSGEVTSPSARSRHWLRSCATAGPYVAVCAMLARPGGLAEYLLGVLVGVIWLVTLARYLVMLWALTPDPSPAQRFYHLIRAFRRPRSTSPLERADWAADNWDTP